MKCATCGHKQGDHIREEGPCRPGFVCEMACEKFVPNHSGWYHRTERHYTHEIFHWAPITQAPDGKTLGGNVYGPFSTRAGAMRDATNYHKCDIAFAERAIANIKGASGRG